MRGIVRKYDQRAGFGFIRCRGLSGMVFVHVTDTIGEGLQEGKVVEFELVHTDCRRKRPRARACRIVKEDERTMSDFGFR
jgi:cold shock CspA family protein